MNMACARGYLVLLLSLWLETPGVSWSPLRDRLCLRTTNARRGAVAPSMPSTFPATYPRDPRHLLRRYDWALLAYITVSPITVPQKLCDPWGWWKTLLSDVVDDSP